MQVKMRVNHKTGVYCAEFQGVQTVLLVHSVVANQPHIQLSSKFIRAWVFSPSVCSSDFRIKLGKITAHKDMEHTDYRQLLISKLPQNDACDPLVELKEVRKIQDT